MRSRRKYILLIVEGPTDGESLATLVSEMMKDNTRVLITQGDMLSDWNSAVWDIKKKVAEFIKRELGKAHLQKKDILQIIHVTDTDGGYVPDTYVQYSESCRLKYTENEILTNDVDGILARNRRKTMNTKVLATSDTLFGLPYRLVFMSRNIEHALCGKSGELSDDDKYRCADTLVDTYRGNIPEFLDLLAALCIGDYRQSWMTIMQEGNSLKRSCNFIAALKDIPNHRDLMNFDI